MASEHDWSGKTLGKYRVLRRLGQGGMGVVYLAHDPRLDRHVALKVLPQSLSEDPVLLERFLREARAAARFNHANVVTVHEIDEQDGICFLAMELMAGSILDLVRSQGRLSWQNASRAIAAVCRALAAAHPAGLVHRDIKPSNILRTATGEVKLSDFGLAKSAGVESSLTTSNAVLGTPTYMSPEQCRSEPLDERSDLYSLGVSYFELLTGRPPYSAEQPLQICFAHCMTPIPDPRDLVEGIPEPCVTIVRRAMAKEPRDRYSTAAEMLADLRRALADPNTTEPNSGDPQSSLPRSLDTRQLAPPQTTRATPMYGDPSVVARQTSTPAPMPTSLSPPSLDESSPPSDATEAQMPFTVIGGRRQRDVDRKGLSALRQLTRRQWFKPAAITAGLAAGSFIAWKGWNRWSTPEPDPSGKTPPPTSPTRPGLPLFNGVNLTGWTIRPSTGDWRVVDGVIVGRGQPGDSYLYHERSDWSNFELRVQCRINDRGNSGIFFRCPLNDNLPPGYEAHIDLWNCGRFHRTGLSGLDGINPRPQVNIAAGEWFRFEVLANESHFRLQVNGTTTVEYTETMGGPTSGFLALQCYERATVVEFKQIEWRPL